MGKYLNPGMGNFETIRKSKIFVDKTKLLLFTNSLINTNRKNICVTRPHRFGKTAILDMLAAYYGSNNDGAKEIFKGTNIEEQDGFTDHLNKYDVIRIDMADLRIRTDSVEEMTERVEKCITDDLIDQYPDVPIEKDMWLTHILHKVYSYTGREFILLIDNYDDPVRYYENEKKQNSYLNYLSTLVTGCPYIALTYMTGLLPVKRDGDHALNMMDEYSVICPDETAGYFGWTEDETAVLCREHGMDPKEIKQWYGGFYMVKKPHRAGDRQEYLLYNPQSVTESLAKRDIDVYWPFKTNYSSLRCMLDMPINGIKETIIELLAGGEVRVNHRMFPNSYKAQHDIDSILTFLVHMGYLSYDTDTLSVKIPNREIKEEILDSIRKYNKYSKVYHVMSRSDEMRRGFEDEDTTLITERIKEAAYCISSLKHTDRHEHGAYILDLACYYLSDDYYVHEDIQNTGGEDAVRLYLPRDEEDPAVILTLADRGRTHLCTDWREERPKEADGYDGPVVWLRITYDDSGNYYCRFSEDYWEEG